MIAIVLAFSGCAVGGGLPVSSGLAVGGGAIAIMMVRLLHHDGRRRLRSLLAAAKDERGYGRE